MMRRNLLVAVLWLAVMASALAVVTVRHQNRVAFLAWRQAEAAKIELQSEWGRRLLERTTWARDHNIAADARARFAMAAPAPRKVVTLRAGE